MTSPRTLQQNTYSAPIVTKAIRVMRYIVTAERNPGISEIATKLGLAKSTTHGILAALEEAGWVLRDPITRRYSCGYALKQLLKRAQVRIPLVQKARPHLEKLAAELDEDVFLGICPGNFILILDQVASSREMRISARPGTRLPLFAGGAGRLFLAYENKDYVTKIIRTKGLPQHGPNSITDPKRYLKELQQVRETGVAIDMEEYLANVWAVAFPIFFGKKTRKRLVAGFWVVGINSETTAERMREAERLGKLTGDALSHDITTNGYEEVR